MATPFVAPSYSPVFSVGNASPEAASSGPESDQKILQSPLEPVVRWLVLMGVLTLFGGFVFELVITRPILLGNNTDQVLRQLGQRMTSRTFKLIWFAMAVVLIASLAQLVLQTSSVFNVPLDQVFGGRLISILTETKWGNLWLWRVGLLLPMGALVPFQGEAYDNQSEFTFFAPVLRHGHPQCRHFDPYRSLQRMGAGDHISGGGHPLRSDFSGQIIVGAGTPFVGCPEPVLGQATIGPGRPGG